MRKGSLSTKDLSSVQTFIKPLFYVRSIWKGSTGTANDLYQSISGKMQETVRPRPDVVQIAHAYSVQAKIEGVSYESVIDAWLREFNERATSTKKVSDLEARIIKILPLQTQVTQQKIAYHWQNFKIESALPYSQLSSDAWLYGTTLRDTANALWSLIQAASPEKRQFSVQRKIGVFLRALTDAKRLRKKVNLMVMSGSFRDGYSAETSWEIACLFCHFCPDFQRVLTPCKWTEVQKRFSEDSLMLSSLRRSHTRTRISQWCPSGCSCLASHLRLQLHPPRQARLSPLSDSAALHHIHPF